MVCVFGCMCVCVCVRGVCAVCAVYVVCVFHRRGVLHGLVVCWMCVGVWVFMIVIISGRTGISITSLRNDFS